MTDDERARARKLLEHELPHPIAEAATGCIFTIFGVVLGGFAGAILVALASALLSLPSGQWALNGVGTFALLGGARAAWWIWSSWRARVERARPLAQDVEAGIVEVLEVEAFIAWADFDSVPAFTLDVADERPLTVRGEGIAAAVAAGTFPCRRFRLVRLPATKHALSVEPRGEPLPVRA